MPDIPAPVHDDADVHRWMSEQVVAAREVWVLDEGDRPVAMLVLDEGWIDQLYVHPDHSGRGLGSRLVELAKQRGAAGLDLWTFQSNAGARRFYERHGFHPVEWTDGDNEEGAPDVRYRWQPPAG